MTEEVLKVLANETNQGILGLLAIEPTYPRKIGDLLQLAEAEVARRLKHMEQLGLVSSSWTYIGKNVKLYTLKAESVTLRFGPEGLRLALALRGAADARDVALTPFVLTLPDPGDFVGRQRELATLGGPEQVVIVEGMVGIGKTSLLATYARTLDGGRSVFWHSFRGVESLNWLANRLALFYARHGNRALLEAVERGAEVADKRQLMLQGLRDDRYVLVLDDVHRVEDDSVRDFLIDACENGGPGKIVLSTREPLRLRRAVPSVRVYSLEGLADEDVRRFLDFKEVTAPARLLPKIREEVGGHPLALNLLVETATSQKVPLEKLLDRIPEKNLEEYLLQEVYEGLEDEERTVLTLASLFRTGFTLEDLHALSAKTHEAALVKLRRRLLVQAQDHQYSLHEVIRNFFYQHLQDKERLHAKAAQHYLSLGTVEGRLEAMHHLLAAGHRARVLELLEQNLDLKEFDFIDSGYQNLYLGVLELFDRKEVADPRRWALIQDEKGDIRFHRSEYERALGLYDEAVAYFEKARDGARVADLAWKRAMAHARLGRSKEAVALLERTLKETKETGRARDRLEELLATLAPVAKPTGRTR